MNEKAPVSVNASLLKKRLYLLLFAFVMSIVFVVAIFYITQYLPANEANELIEKLKVIIFAAIVLIVGALVYSDKKIKEVETLEEMKYRFDIRFLSIILSLMIVIPLTILIQHYFPATKGGDSTFVMLFILIIFEGLVTRSAIAGYVFKKLNPTVIQEKKVD